MCENSQPGTPIPAWYTEDSWGDIQGFPTAISVQPGQTINFKVTSTKAFDVSVYRMGYYGGDGARLMPTSPTGTFPAKNQAPCMHDSATGLVDCGNWTTNLSWAVPSTAVSGIYFMMLDVPDGSGFMPVPFVVRNDSSHSDILVQTSDETWQAYNTFGGQNVYNGGGPAPDGRAYKASYNRPLDVSGDNGFFQTEFPMVQWLERNGYDVSYTSGLDVTTNASILLNHKVYLDSGHDEYFSQGQWDHVMAARAAGVNLAFFSGNEVFWRTRFEPSIDGSNTPNRTIAVYKSTKLSQTPPDGIPDPSGQWTGTWMDPDGATTGGGKPQNQLTGTLFSVNGYRQDAITVGAAFKNLRLWRNTSITSLGSTEVATFPLGTLGYEWDSDIANSVRPTGAIDFSATTVSVTDGTLLLDNGNTYGNGTATHNLVEYRDQTSGALVFGAGTVQWAWGLSAFHSGPTTTEDVRMQQATLNLFADMGVQPLTKQTNLVAATKSTDVTKPTVTITSPAANATVGSQTAVTISGTASDVGGQVARVEYSLDGGTTWSAAAGLANWSFSWTPGAPGTAALKVRAVDDSVNIGLATTLNLTIGSQVCPCSVFSSTTVPTTVDAGDNSAVELGAKIRVGAAGAVTGVKFYKAASNTGTHVAHLWSATGTLLGSATFTGESGSGWQTVNFASPVPVAANTTYVVSYYAPVGRYSLDSGYFTTKNAGGTAVQELKSGVDGPNGVYHYGSGGGFPGDSYGDANYWVDAIVTNTGAPTTPPTVTTVTPAANATGVGNNAAITAKWSQDVDTSTIVFSVTPSGGAAVPATVSYDQPSHTATLHTASALNPSTSYTASAKANDVWGNVQAAAFTWSFTTGASGATSCPCSLWSTTTVPANPSANDPNSVELGARFTSAVAGHVTGVRFYKGSLNTGTHTGSLWSNTGTLLATGTFTGESASGWQTLTFTTPVAITANTPYVISYHAPNGNYAYNSQYFATAYTAFPLTATADGTNGANGVYLYSASSSFPSNTYGSTNYWVDPILTTP